MNEQDLRDLGDQVLITGAKGFIGRALHMRLPNARGVSRGACSLATPASLEAALKGVRVIFHLAGVNAGSGYVPPTDSMAKDNVLATYGLLQGIKQFASARPLVVFLSSIHVYRSSDRYSETSELAPSSYYGLTKLTQELLLREAASSGCIDTLIFRAANIYGPGCRPNYNSAVATFCHRIRADLTIELMGNGKSQVDLIFVDDAITILLGALELQKRGCSIYNLSSGESRSVSEVLDTLARMSGRAPLIRVVNTAPQEFVVDNSRLLEALGGFKFTDLETGLFKTYHADGVSTSRHPSEAKAS